MKTLKEENIVNISMKASELLMAGRIQPDQADGHAGMTDAIVSLAEKFEQQNAGVDFDAEDRDYWLEIDAFAEENLLQVYGLEEIQDKPSPTVSMLCEEHEDEGGIREFFVLAVSEDKEMLRGLMEAKIRKDPYGLIASNGVDDHGNDHFTTKFNDGFVEYYILDEPVRSRDEMQAIIAEEQGYHDFPVEEVQKDHVKVFACAGSVKHEVFSGDYDECVRFCEENDGFWKDGNDFVWELDLEDDRDLPGEYFDAVDYYEDTYGEEFDCESARQDYRYIVECYKGNIDIKDHCGWNAFEKITGEEMTFSEARALGAAYDGDPFYVAENLHEHAEVSKIKQAFNQIRNGEAAHPSLTQRIQAAAKQADKSSAETKQVTNDLDR